MAKSWEKMTRAERRVAVAKDVIKSLQDGIFSPSPRAFVDSDSPSGLDRKYEEPTQAWAERILSGPDCKVCARGGMMLCKLSKYNHWSPRTHFDGFVTRRDTALALSDCFTKRQLNKIEAAYELWSDKAGGSPLKFGLRFKYKGDRMQAIMQNIIDNNGDFKPGAEK